MASVWDRYTGEQPKKQNSVWDKYVSAEDDFAFPETTEARAKPESRGILGAANDYVIEAANAILGGGKALVDFAVPGTELANQIEALIRQGEESQSDVARQAKQRLGQGIEAGGMEALGAVGEYITESPGLALSQAAGSFAIPLGTIKGAQLGAQAVGATGRAAKRAEDIVGPFTPTGAGSKAAARAAAIRGVETRVGTAAGMGVGAVLGAGEAAGDAYEQVYQGLVDQGVDPIEAERQATEAARLAMPAPALVGAVAGRFGAERAVAAGTRGGSILRMAGSEAAQEFAEEGTTKLSANIAAGQYVDGIDPMKGVLGSAALGAALGGITGGAIGTITPLDKQPGSLLGGANDQLSGSRTPGGDALRQAINVQQGAGLSTQELINQLTGVSRPKPTSTAASMEAALNEPTGQMVSGPGGIERQLTAGELYGVPRAPAQTPAGQAPAQAAGQQRAQPAAQPVTQEEYVQTAQAYGVAPAQGIANAWDLGGARVYGQPNIRAVVEGLAQADRQANPVQREVSGALLAANLVKISGNIANAKPVINAINRAVQKFGLTDVASVEEAVARVNDQIANLARQGKPATNTMVEQLDQLHVALTGESSPVYTQLLEGASNEQQAATGVGAVSEQAGAGQAAGGVGRTDVGPLQSLLAGSDAGRPTGVQDVAAGVGGARGGAAVAPAGEPVGDGRPVSGQVPDQGQEVNVQPTGQPSPGAQTNVGRTFRVTRPRAEGAGAGAPEAAVRVEPTVEPRVERAGESEEVVTARRIFDAIATRFEVGSRFDNLAPALQNIWLEAVAANKATIEVIRALDTENQLNDASMSAQNILDTAVSKLFPMAKQQNKARFVAEMLGTPQAARNETVKQLAERFKVSEDTIKKDWNRAVKALLGEDRPKLVGAIDAVMRERGLNQEQVSELLADLQEAVELARTTETLTAVPEGEAQIDKRDLADPEKDLREADRKSLSVQEFGNEAEVLSARYVNLSEEIDTVEQELEAARAEGDENIVAELSARLGELTTTLAETEAAIVKNADRQVKSVRRTAGRVKKEKEDAVQEPGAEELDVRQRARTGEEVAEKDTEKQAVAREGKAEGKAKGKVVRVVKAAPKAAPAPAVSKTKAEEVEAKYNELRGFAPDLLPEWSMLTEEQRNKLLAIDNPADINFKNLEQLISAEKPVQFSKRRLDEMTKSNVADIEQSIYNFVGAVNQERLRIVQSVKDVPLYVREAIKKQTKQDLSDTEQAFVYGGRAYLIADNIVPGTERAVFMHEVGSHLGLEKILSNKQIIALAEQIQKWANKDDGSVESRIANAAYDRLIAAELDPVFLSPTSRRELIAYFIEEATLAGINPTAIDAKTALGRWFRTVWTAFKSAIRKLRLDPERLNAVDVVNMAYGAAKLEITGTWHGSAAIFQNFRTQYIGTGEGAQAFGWGMYFARSYEIAKDYFKRDKQRKSFEAFVNRSKIEQYITETQAKIDEAIEQSKTFPALNRELNRDVPNPETQEVLFPKGTIITKEVLLELNRLGIDVIEIKGSSLPKTDPDFDPRVSAAEILTIPFNKLPEDSLWRGSKLKQAEDTVAFFEDWLDINAPETIEKQYERSRTFGQRVQKAKFIQDAARKLVEQNPEYNAVIEEFYVTATPAGSIMRADVGFGVDQTLIWDKPFSQQSSLVQDKLLQAKGLANFPKDMLNKATGADIYKYFATGALGRDYVAGQDKDASEELYKLGIKGISYFDRSSRTIDFPSYDGRAELTALARELGTTGESFSNNIEWLGAEQVINTYNLKDSARAEVLAYEKYIDQNRTRNIIAFNEADVVRVFSQIGMEGSNAIDRVQFSRRADAAISRLPTVAQPQATQIYYTLKDWASKVAPTFAFTQDLVDLAKKLMPSSKDFIRLYNEKQVTQTDYELQVKAITDAYDALPNEVKGVGAGSVNRFIKDSTMSGKWGYKIKSDSNVTLDPQLEARFNAFPKEAQDVIKSVFDHGYKVLQDMKNAIRNNVNTEYDALIEAAKDRGDDKEVAQLQEAKDGVLRDYQRLFALRGTGPYAPLKRFGNYVVIGKSQRFLDLEAALEKAKPDTRAALRKQLTELERQAEHYYVAFAETAGEGQVIANSISNQYAMVTDPFEKSVEESLYGGSDLNQVFARLRNLSEENLKDADNTAVARGIRKMIVDMQTMMLSQQSVMHATNRRLGVAGADDDMMRAFSTQGRASAHFIGSLTNTGKIYEQLRKMRKEAGYNPEARRYFNEFVLRHNMGYDYDPSPILNKAMATTSLWMLLTSPAYYLQNATQPLMMSVPFMAGTHGEGRSLAALLAAYKEAGKLLQDISVKRPGQQVDFDKLSPDVRDMVKELVKRGRIQITLDRDLGEYTSGEDSAFRKLGKVSEYLRSVAEKVELTNRVATAIAAYRLQTASGKASTDATNYADKVIRVTHGSYAGADAPRFMRKGIGRLVTQFRKFQLIQISMMVRLLNDATKNADPKERAAARRALVWTFTHAGVAGGIMGLPGFAAAAALYGMLFADEDEPFDAELEMRKYFGDELGTLMTKGLPAQFGVDVSGKIGMGQMLSILPYTDFDLNRAGWQETVTAAMGPFIGGLMPRAIDGARFISEGNYYRGLENLLPKGVGDTLKGIRLSTEGITQRNNDVVLDAEEITFVDGLFQAFGLPTTKITGQQFRTRTKIEAEEFYSKLTTELKREYAKAYRENDNLKMAELRERWKAIQDKRVARELKRQPLSELLKSPQEQRKRERQTAKGVQYTPATRRFVESLPT